MNNKGLVKQILLYLFFKKKVFYIIIFFYICDLTSYSYENSVEYDIIEKIESQCKSAAVIDAKNGEIIYSHNIDERIFPASLTKIMTAYVVFDAIDKGMVGIKDNIELIEKIAPNEKITISDLLHKMIIKSSNIASDILAQEIYGSVDEFVSKMNYFAKKIGMKNTNFTNTNGLYDKNNYSTARDIAKLSIRIVYDFPQYIDLFGVTNYFDKNGKYDTKTSKIQDNLTGLEGGKTGYLNASGYNFSVWGSYGDKHLFIVLIGAKNKNSRDLFVIELINLGTNGGYFYKKKDHINEQSIFKKIFNFLDIKYNSYNMLKPIERINKNLANNKS